MVIKTDVIRCSHCKREVRVESFRYDNSCPSCCNVLPPVNPDYKPQGAAKVEDKEEVNTKDDNTADPTAGSTKAPVSSPDAGAEGVDFGDLSETNNS